MKDVALEVGVHPTTVSLALRNSPQLPLATRQRIQTAARKMGYHQDPMLSALVAYRANVSLPKFQPEVAMIFDFKSPEELAQGSLAYRLFLTGATRKAEELGYKIRPCFFEGPSRQSEGQRIGRILVSRGVKGAIICAFRPGTTRFEFDWDQFSVVQIESQHLALPVHSVSTDQMMMAREAVRRLAQRGFRRLGMAVGCDEEIYLDHAFTMGFYGEAWLHPGLKLAPVLVLPNGQSPDEIAPPLRQWIRQRRIEAIISNWNSVPAALAASRAKGTPDPDLVLLSLPADPSQYDGMRQRDMEVGEQAMEQLAMLLKTNQTGCIAAPNRILVPGTWVAGTRPVGPRRRG
jgi:LacI family transcriptional regulator